MKKEDKGHREKPRSMPNNDKYRENYDRIFGAKKEEVKKDAS